jgi:hypothetical protein
MLTGSVSISGRNLTASQRWRGRAICFATVLAEPLDFVWNFSAEVE